MFNNNFKFLFKNILNLWRKPQFPAEKASFFADSVPKKVRKKK